MPQPNPTDDDFDKMTLLAHATYKGNLVGVKLLVAKGAKLNDTGHTQSKQTPLMIACEGSRAAHVEIVQYLIAQGADILARDSKGKTAYDYAHSGTYMNFGDVKRPFEQQKKDKEIKCEMLSTRYKLLVPSGALKKLKQTLFPSKL
jgi:hypothetical protein